MSDNIAKTIIKPENCIVAFGIPTTKKDFYNDLDDPNKDYVDFCLHLHKMDISKTWKSYDRLVIQVSRKVEEKFKALGVRDVVHRCTLERLGELLQQDQVKVVVFISHRKIRPQSTTFSKQEYLRLLEKDSYILEHITHSRNTLEWLQTIPIHKEQVKQKLAELKDKNVTPLVELVNGSLQLQYDEIVRHHLKEIGRETFAEILEHTQSNQIEFFDRLYDLSEIADQIPLAINCFLDLNVCPPEAFTHVLRKVRPDINFKYKMCVPDDPMPPGMLFQFSLHFYRILFQHLKENELNYLDAYEQVSAAFMNAKQGGPIEKIKRYFQKLCKKLWKAAR